MCPPPPQSKSFSYAYAVQKRGLHMSSLVWTYLLGSRNWKTADILGMAVTVASVLTNDIPAALERIRTVNCSPLAGTYVWRVELWKWSVICLHFLQEMAVPISWSPQGQLMKSGIGWKPFCAVGDFVTSRIALFKDVFRCLVMHTSMKSIVCIS